MKISFELAAEFRDGQGKGASRRLRHTGRVPAILYGGHTEPRAISLDHQKLMTLIDNEKFYSSIINLKVGDKTQAAIVKDLQMHPARNAIQHVDMQRVVETEKIRIHIPIHFKGEAASPGVKSEGGVVSHRIADVEISCLPKDLPEFIELDLSGMHINESKHLSDLPLPEGVTIPAIAKGNATVVSIHPPRAEEPEPTAEAAAAAPAEGAAAAAPAAADAAKAGDAKAAAPAAGDAKAAAAPAKKEGGKK
ncbi:MAG TPA: 50S ribosomal protein L25/general stress protein Ctc [Steroidobacteraceae bacterium]|jgi:large subunit ribosomal protein L25|nr:50S ribosomal protein L25/general stress protein Ctc [Steroidobacteraceae bacterium]